MRVMLSDGSGLTSRQCATLLARAGHRVTALAPKGLTLTRVTKHVAKVYEVPAYGPDPLVWWAAALDHVRAERPDVLLPTQEQVAVLSLRQDELRALGTGTVVPDFAALRRVQDKLAADATLRAAGLPRPPSWVAAGPAELAAGVSGPAFLKIPVATASTGVLRVRDAAQAAAAAATLEAAGGFADGGILVEEPVPGPLLMVQSVFDHGRLVALHVNERTREGANGGAAIKTSRVVAGLAEQVETLGAHLGWHGALSLDAIDADGGPRWIDVNPRLVEPGNAARAGVDLLAPMLALASGGPPPERAPLDIPGVVTHQLLLAVLGAAQEGRGRRGIAAELLAGLRHRGPYAGSAEELTPVAGDPRAALPVLVAAAECLVSPARYTDFTSDAVGGYALTPAGWRQLLAEA